MYCSMIGGVTKLELPVSPSLTSFSSSLTLLQSILVAWHGSMCVFWKAATKQPSSPMK